MFTYYIGCLFYPFLYRLRDSAVWQLAFMSPYIEPVVDRIALNAKVIVSNPVENSTKMLAMSYNTQVRLWGISENGTKTDIGETSLILLTLLILLYLKT